MRLYISILFFIIASRVYAVDTLYVDNINEYPVIDYIEYFADIEGVETINSVQQKTFRKLEKKTISFGMQTRFVWVRFSIKNKRVDISNYVLNVNNADLNEVVFYELRNNTLWKKYETGEVSPNKTLDTYYRTYFYNLTLAANLTSTIYIKIGNSGDAIIAPISLSTQEAFSHDDYFESITYTFIYGILAFIILISVILYLKFRERVYLFATLYMFFGLLLIATIFGFTSQILFTDSPVFVDAIRIILTFLTAICGLTFGYEFLQIKVKKLYTRRLVLIFDTVGILLAASSLLPSPFNYIAYITWPFFIISFLFFLLYWSFVVYRTNKIPAIVIVLSFVPIMISVTLLFLRSYGLYQSTTVLIGFQYVLPLQMIIVAYGMVENIQRQHNRMVENLREKNNIIERQTFSLVNKNKELERLTIASSNSDNGIAIFDKNGNIQWYNKFFSQSYNCIIDDIENKSKIQIAEIIPNLDIIRYFDQCRNTKQSVVFEISKHCKHQEKELAFQTTLTPILNEQGEIENFVTVESDISEIKEAGKEKEMLQLRIAQMEKLESIGKLAGGIAHDFNNLLTPIIGYADMLLMDNNLSKENREDVESINVSAQRAKKLVNQILIFSNYFKPVITKVSVDKIIREILKIQTKSVGSIKFSYLPIAKKVYVSADETHIHQVIMNICKNGVQAMGNKGGELTISVDVTELLPNDISQPIKKCKNYVQISITDTGYGMDDETKQRIFDPFFTTKHISEGTGLGMSVVHGIIQQYNGAVEIKSIKGEGTTISVFFPLADKKESYEPDIKKTTEKYIIGKSQTILLIDDDENITQVFVRLLTARGWQVTAYNDSFQALEAYRQNPQIWNLVITDQTMPTLLGSDLAKEMLTINSLQQIILMTGYSESINKEQAKQIGISQFILKPITSAQLLTICDELLSKNDTN